MVDTWFRALEERSTEMTMNFADVNGVRLAYRVRGKGPPLVLIMGYRLNSGAWPDAFIDTLAQQFTVITFDNRGTGQSEKPVTGYALANMARDLYELLRELGITSTYLLGYSMGGAIAQEFVRQFPQHVKWIDPVRDDVWRITGYLCQTIGCAGDARS
jgi:pimeloyl-ACP methyl ester carboxylesterase